MQVTCVVAFVTMIWKDGILNSCVAEILTVSKFNVSVCKIKEEETNMLNVFLFYVLVFIFGINLLPECMTTTAFKWIRDKLRNFLVFIGNFAIRVLFASMAMCKTCFRKWI